MRNRFAAYLATAFVFSACGNIEVKGGGADTGIDTSACTPRCIGAQPIGCDSDGNEVLGQECADGTTCSQGVCIPGTTPGPDTTDSSGSDTAADSGSEDTGPPDTNNGEDTTSPDTADDSSGSDASCTPQCDEKLCGDDGCGGTCGDCAAGQTCDTDGQCVCTPNAATTCSEGDVYWQDSCGNTGALNTPCEFGCTDGTCDGCTPNCENKECGDNGCGGTCGTCQVDGQVCDGGGCVCVGNVATTCSEGDVYWQDSCGNTGALSTACEFGCTDGTCDTCTPNCENKACGDNGCGGTCGTCTGAQDLCVGDQCVCQPDCAGDCGPDGCGGSCGTCGAGETCADTNNNNVVDTCQCDPVCAAGQECGLDSCGGNTCGACDAGTVCAANNTCVECISSANCAAGLVCDTANNACVECMGDSDCASSNSLGNSCFDNLCVVRYVLDTDSDFVDQSPGDGVCFGVGPTSNGCSLRAAIMESNNDGARNVIQLAAEKTFTISVATDFGTDEAPSLGDFELYKEEKITSGPDIIFTSDLENAYANIDGAENHRIFQVVSGEHHFRWVHLTRGRAKCYGGGALRIDSAATVDLRHVMISGNSDTCNGQTVAINGGSLRAFDTKFFDNDGSPFNGGAINMQGGSLQIDRCAFFRNRARFRGAAINGGFGITVTNSVFYDNTLLDSGSEGGTINSTSGTYLYNTIWGNTDSMGGNATAGLFTAGTSTLRGNVITQNLSGNSELNCAGNFTSDGYNFINGSTECNVTTVQDSDKISDAGNPNDAMLQVASEGAVVPVAGSPLIDAAPDPNCPPTDQLLTPRPQGPACDIGSVEAL